MEIYSKYCTHFREVLTSFTRIVHASNNPLTFFKNNTNLVEITAHIEGMLQALDAIKQGLIDNNATVPMYLENYTIAMTLLWHHLYALSPALGVKYLNEDAQISTETAVNPSHS